MATSPKLTDPWGPPGKSSLRNAEELHKDQVTLAIILGVFVAVMVILIALIAGGVLPAGNEMIEPWIMP